MSEESPEIHKRRRAGTKNEGSAKRNIGDGYNDGNFNKSHDDKVTMLDIARVLLGLFIVINCVLSYTLTQTFSWGLKGTRYFDLNYWQHQLGSSRGSLILNDEELSLFNGTNGSRIYLAIEGDIYDVTCNRKMYQPGAPYAVLAGRDASRVFASGCFEPSQLTYDLRGLDSDSAHSQLDRWHKFFQSSNKYWRIGTVIHPDLSGDPPPVCSGSPKP